MEQANEIHIGVVAVHKRTAKRWVLVAAPEVALLEAAVEHADEESYSGAGWSGQVVMSWRPPTGATLLAEHNVRVETLRDACRRPNGSMFRTYRSALLRLSEMGVRVYL